MTGATDKPQPVLRFAGQRPDDGTRAPAPWHLAVALRDYAQSKGLAIGRLERSRVGISGSIYLTMTDARGRPWTMRVSNHRRRSKTGHATPHVDLVSLDGNSGIGPGRKLIDAIVGGEVEWFDPEQTVRHLALVRRNAWKRRK